MADFEVNDISRSFLVINAQTRPGRLLVLVANIERTWTTINHLFFSGPSGHCSTFVGVDEKGDLEPISSGFMSKWSEFDYVVCVGDVPQETVQNVQRRFSLPEALVIDEQDDRFYADKYALIEEATANHDIGRAPYSALPIPMTAMTGVVPNPLFTKVTVDASEVPNETRSLYFELDRILSTYDQYLLAPGRVKTLDIVSHSSGHQKTTTYVFVGTSDDLKDYLVYNNLVRRYSGQCIWLPGSLFAAPNLHRTLEKLGAWVRTRLQRTGYQESIGLGLVLLVPSQQLVQTISEQADLQWARANLGSQINYDVRDLKTETGPAGPWEDSILRSDILAIRDRDTWSIPLTEVPDVVGGFPVTHLYHTGLAGLPASSLRFNFPDGRVRPTDRSLLVHREGKEKRQASVLLIREPTDLEVMRSAINENVEPSDKAGPVLALLKLTGGIQECSSIFLDPSCHRLMEDLSLESLHRWLKDRLIKNHGSSESSNQESVDEIVKELGDRIRRDRKNWYSLSELNKRGVTTERIQWLTSTGVFERGLRLECPDCHTKACYPPQLLSGFTCAACGWKGTTPIPQDQVAVFYSVRDLVVRVVQDGSVPVILTLSNLESRIGRFRSWLFPGMLLPFNGGKREVDIVSQTRGSLLFWEVKQNARHAIPETDGFIELCDHYGAIPGFAAFRGLSSLDTYLRSRGVSRYNLIQLRGLDVDETDVLPEDLPILG